MGKWMERKYTCRKKNLVERSRFWVSDNTVLRPRWRKAKSAQDKRDENSRAAVRQLARLLNCNADEEWLFVKLDFSPKSWTELFAGMTEDQILQAAQKQGALFLRRLKRAMGKEKLGYILVASDMDGKTGEKVRVHLHLALSKVPAELIREKWTLGENTDIRNFNSQEDYTPVAAYLLKQVRDVENMKSYIPSRNLEKPIIEDRVVEGPEQEIRVQPGAVILDRTEFKIGMTSQYVRYIKRPRPQKRGGHKEHLEKESDCNGLTPSQ